MNVTELKPCPFCGKMPMMQTDTRYPPPEGEPRTAYEVVCKNFDCIIYGADTKYFLSAQKAKDAWNKRADNANTSKGDPARQGAWIEEEYESKSARNRIIHYKKYKCSLCNKGNGRKKSPHCPNCGAKMDAKEECE